MSNVFVVSEDWATVTIGQLCKLTNGTVQTGPFGSDLHASDYHETGTPVVMPANLGKNQIVEEGIARVAEEHVLRLRQHRLAIGDIIFPRRGDVARYALIDERYVGWLCGTGCLRIRFEANNVIEPKFLGYWLGTQFVQGWLLSNAVGTTMPNLNTSILKVLPVPLPPLPEQRAIAHILRSLDDKIELNRRMNATLEAMARAIFQAWFVDFDPVHAKARGEPPSGMDADTAALFPDAFEESALGMIPAGWRVGTLGEIAQNPRHSVNPDEMNPDIPYFGLEHMPQQSIALVSWGYAGDVSSNKYTFNEGDFLFGKLRPYFHKVGVAPVDGVCSTDILVVAPLHSVWRGIVLSHLSSEIFVNYTTSASTGTRMPRTNWQDMSRYPIVIPTEEVAGRFNDVIMPMIALIKTNIFQSRTLAALRDMLLPRLISGDLRVPEAEHAGRMAE